MSPRLLETADKGIEAELERLTCSAYLLTLDPGLALSVVMAALDRAEEELGPASDLLRSTVELSLRQLRREPTARSDRESSAFEAVLYGYSTHAASRRSASLKENMSGNPILALDYSARIAFVLHHVLGYKLNEAAAMSDMSEKEFRAHLRQAYLQLASSHFGSGATGSEILGESALG
jgi:DNA-directed RNA polymerase specialized sigma24 family protein